MIAQLDATRLRTAGPSTSYARGALTLVELLLAILGTVLVSMALAAMLAATAYATSNRTDVRSVAVKHKVIAGRMGAAIRSSKTVLDEGDDYLVLWMDDANLSGQPNLSEIRRIERDNATNELRSYKAPDSLLPADDTEYDLLTDDFNAQTNSIKGTANFPLTLWAAGVTAWTITLDDGDPLLASLVSYRMTIAHDELLDTTIGATALRNK